MCWPAVDGLVAGAAGSSHEDSENLFVFYLSEALLMV